MGCFRLLLRLLQSGSQCAGSGAGNSVATVQWACDSVSDSLRPAPSMEYTVSVQVQQQLTVFLTANLEDSQMKSSELQQGLFTDSYCRVCTAQLISQSQRLAHYQSRKHANKVRLYYMLHPQDGGCPAKKLRTDSACAFEWYYGGCMMMEVGEAICLKCSHTCEVCSVTLNSVAQYHAHLQGSKHQNNLKSQL
ncbi:hypothetical protein SKAU_G00284490 [Synaphobranchus kaupii]|uniref:U1-type domain-containing protein n=1 Tax=Synaphobranchus kaupii TaxID=118154 RepID=A0A9Q1IPB9_SYNKA|nr:hypothetical protein SKAU_G00284490 [Synaphobranchus kaupii]